MLPRLEDRELLQDIALGQFLADCDRTLTEGLYKGGTWLAGHAARWIAATDDQPGGWVLRYGNAEIVDRIVRVYIAEYQRSLRADIVAHEQATAAQPPSLGEDIYSHNYELNCMLLQRSVAADGQLYRDQDIKDVLRKGEGEHEADYLRQLASLAESTFSPRIYDYVWAYPNPGTWKMLYLANVLPERTMEHLVTATLAERLGHPRPEARDLLFRIDTGAFLQISDAMQVLAFMARSQEDTVRKYRDQCIAFLQRHAMHYRNSRLESRYSKTRDYFCRLHALQILEVAGDRKDAAQTEAIASDAPSKEEAIGHRKRKASVAQYPEIAEKALQVANVLRNRNR